MTKNFKCVQIVQGSQKGSVSFIEVDEKGEPLKKAVQLALQFDEPKEAACFDYGREYKITIEAMGQ